MTSRPLRATAAAALSALLFLLTHGCRSAAAPGGDGPPARYERNAAALAERADLAGDPALLAALERALERCLGTPGAPRYRVLSEWRAAGFDPNCWPDAELVSDAAERPPLAESAELFRARCARCHGISGGGDGPMARRLRTRPRDYRHGTFKRKPLERSERPRLVDLVETLMTGIPGTAMPAWQARLSRAEIEGLAEYVRLLAIRGETERMALLDLEAGEPFDEGIVREAYALAVERWRNAGSPIDPGPPPGATPARVAHGAELFRSPMGAGCVRCHGPEGHGNGTAALAPDPRTGEPVPLRDEWGNPIRPRDLVCATIRFGDTPQDLYRRIHAGIAGTPMPAHAGAWVSEPDGERHPLGPDDIWDLVLFVRSLREPATEGATADQGR